MRSLHVSARSLFRSLECRSCLLLCLCLRNDIPHGQHHISGNYIRLLCQPGDDGFQRGADSWSRAPPANGFLCWMAGRLYLPILIWRVTFVRPAFYLSWQLGNQCSRKPFRPIEPYCDSRSRRSPDKRYSCCLRFPRLWLAGIWTLMKETDSWLHFWNKQLLSPIREDGNQAP